MKKIKKNLIVLALILCFILISYFYFFKNIFSSNTYGRSANGIRELLKVPIIEPSMTKTSNLNTNIGGKWENKTVEDSLSHLWKIVSINGNENRLDEEFDMFRKFSYDKSYWQLNMNSKILGDSISIRAGTLRYYKQSVIVEYSLDENGLDSLFKQWKLYSLIKK